MKRYFIITVLGLFHLACNNHASNEQAITDTTGSENISMPDWKSTDSLEYIYYPDPQNQKVYQHQMITDLVLIQAFVDNLQRPVSGEKTLCPHYSKVYLFTKGEAYKTLYISGSCGYLAFAVNSHQYFIELTGQTKMLIDSLEKISVRL
ncbi:MAG: hypothetical protein J7502_15345 [Flavisolibacter sp.]|nr:hypothetical protein [Flavisolibacter sp.]